ncbi:cytochrome P450 [Embleya sp. NPDC059237]|uniref:cytochrome P450 n=1 Tax=Embleya sp. NPDC059237 TaxID=3346784 RepID=UPI00368A93CC
MPAPLTEREVADQVMTFFVAGMKSTASTPAWAIHLLAAHPQVQDRVRKEADRRSASARAADVGSIGDGEAGRVVAETLRLFPPGWFLTRRVTHDTVLGATPLKAGTTVAFSAWILHRRPDLHPDPDRFDPDRWSTPPGRETYVPFGAGARMCIGDRFAVTEMALALERIVSHWQLRPVGPTPRVAARLALLPGTCACRSWTVSTPMAGDVVDGPRVRSAPDADAIREEVNERLRAHLAEQAAPPRPGTREPVVPPELLRVAHQYLFSGGKRLRPLLCVTGWRAAGGRGRPQPLIDVAAALEMFHVFALVHDDVMDDSMLRRGRPTAQRMLARHHRGRPDAGRLGVCGAILLGDLALVWSDRLLRGAGLAPDRLCAAGAVVDAMRTATLCGQYADVVATGVGGTDEELAIAIARDKTAKYTVEGPLHLGAVLAGADDALLERLSAFAVPLGVAFQLHDDLLGVFGDPTRTGKSCSEDLRGGKYTLLMVLALRHAAPADRARLLRLLAGPRPDKTKTKTRTEMEGEAAAKAGADVVEVRRLLEACGARELVRERIRALRGQALAIVDDAAFAAPAAAELRGWAKVLAPTPTPSRARDADREQGEVSS